MHVMIVEKRAPYLLPTRCYFPDGRILTD